MARKIDKSASREGGAEDKQRMVNAFFKLPEELRIRVKIAAWRSGLTMNDYYIKAVEEKLERDEAED